MSDFACILIGVIERGITMLVAVPSWTEAEIVAVARSPRVAAWRDADRYVTKGPTRVSLDVEAADELEARRLVRAVFGDLVPTAFVSSSA